MIADAARPQPPFTRIIPQGTVLEINNHANAAASPILGTTPTTACGPNSRRSRRRCPFIGGG